MTMMSISNISKFWHFSAGHYTKKYTET